MQDSNKSKKVKDSQGSSKGDLERPISLHKDSSNPLPLPSFNQQIDLLDYPHDIPIVQNITSAVQPQMPSSVKHTAKEIDLLNDVSPEEFMGSGLPNRVGLNVGDDNDDDPIFEIEVEKESESNSEKDHDNDNYNNYENNEETSDVNYDTDDDDEDDDEAYGSEADLYEEEDEEDEESDEEEFGEDSPTPKSKQIDIDAGSPDSGENIKLVAHTQRAEEEKGEGKEAKSRAHLKEGDKNKDELEEDLFKHKDGVEKEKLAKDKGNKRKRKEKKKPAVIFILKVINLCRNQKCRKNKLRSRN